MKTTMLGIDRSSKSVFGLIRCRNECPESRTGALQHLFQDRDQIGFADLLAGGHPLVLGDAVDEPAPGEKPIGIPRSANSEWHSAYSDPWLPPDSDARWPLIPAMIATP